MCYSINVRKTLLKPLTLWQFFQHTFSLSLSLSFISLSLFYCLLLPFAIQKGHQNEKCETHFNKTKKKFYFPSCFSSDFNTKKYPRWVVFVVIFPLAILFFSVLFFGYFLSVCSVSYFYIFCVFCRYALCFFFIYFSPIFISSLC